MRGYEHANGPIRCGETPGQERDRERRQLMLITKENNALNNYFTERDAIEYAFYRIPKALISDPLYRMVSTDAKLLYGLLLDRMDLSVKKRWLDEFGRVYLFYKIEAIQADLCCCKEKACKLLCELESVGLIEKKRQGRGNPSLIYVKHFFKKSEKQTSKGRKSRP